MKRSINAWAFPKNMTFEEIFKLAKDSGFEAIELNVDAVGANAHSFNFNTTDEVFDEVNALKEKYGIEVQSVSTGLYWIYGTFAHEDEAKLGEALRIIRTQLKCAAAIGAEAILVVTSPVKELGLERSFDNTVRVFKSLKDEIAASGVKVGIENVGNNFFTSAMDYKYLIEAIGDENVGMYFDVGNMMAYSCPEWWIDIIGKYILKIHVKDYKRNGGCHTGGGFGRLLKGDINWDVLSPLIAKYYDGAITAEVTMTADDTAEEFFSYTNEAIKTIIAKAN
ncbi:MAG: sugar phosphate isomerase/epimerase [Ruminococcaceae bacterium]|nr:sugar phosphate isomerase/epimerase [Oscillospiraceae bacterium]